MSDYNSTALQVRIELPGNGRT
ncbi:hypothetical protein KIPB_010955, partial [Kipferlia bialata]|eukprot:g10955.t1